MPHKNKEDKLAYMRKYLRKYRILHRESMNAYNRAWRKAHPEYKIGSAARQRSDRKKYPERYKEYERRHQPKFMQLLRDRLRNLRIEMGGKCTKCGYNKVLGILQFHHTGTDKIIEVTRLVREEAMRAEAKKCILLCPNCHAELHLKEKRND